MKARVLVENVKSQVKSKDQKKILDEMINHQLAERMKNHEDNIDAAVLYVLHQIFGFGPKRLRRFYEEFIVECQRMVKYYEMPGEVDYLAKVKLKEIGVDVEAWNDETYGTDRNNSVEIVRDSK